MTYYKWLTPDMTSHRDRRFRWTPEQVHMAEAFDGINIGAQGLGLHLLKDPVDALRFGHWPGRLFEAEPAGTQMVEDEEKVRCDSVRLLQEVEATRVFGPNGERLLTFLEWLKNVPWLEGDEPLEAAVDAAVEYQMRLSAWGWETVPVETVRFEEWIPAADYFVGAVNPAVATGVWTAWLGSGRSWPLWATPWAASVAWSAAWTGLETGAGAAAWVMAKENWTGKVPWPAPNDEVWKERANRLRSSTRIIAGAGANDAARAAEYIVCADVLPLNPFEPLMLVWMLGYWPMGVIDGKYMIGDVSAVVTNGMDRRGPRPTPELLFRQYGGWIS
jgi:hypothetical protein